MSTSDTAAADSGAGRGHTTVPDRIAGSSAEVGVTPVRAIYPVGQHDPLAAPLLAELAIEYSTRYGRTAGAVHRELTEYPATAFEPPHGGLYVVVEHGEVVAGGAFQRFDAETAELKRIWTATTRRRRGLGRYLLERLEDEIAARGYRRIYLTTGERQPEAMGLYLAAGYTALPPFRRSAGRHLSHPFEKYLPATAFESEVAEESAA